MKVSSYSCCVKCSLPAEEAKNVANAMMEQRLICMPLLGSGAGAVELALRACVPRESDRHVPCADQQGSAVQHHEPHACGTVGKERRTSRWHRWSPGVVEHVAIGLQQNRLAEHSCVRANSRVAK